MMFDEFADKRILVIGDIILDRFITGSVDRIAPEAPVPVFKPETMSDNLGGAGNVAANLQDLGCEVILITTVGTAAIAETIRQLVDERSFFDVDFVKDPDWQTPCKTRYYSNSHYILRIDIERPQWITGDPEVELCQKIKQRLAADDIDGVIVADYDKGTMTPRVIESIAKSRGDGVVLVADPKIKNLQEYVGFDALVPNIKELTQVFGKNPLYGDLIRDLRIKALCVTCGQEGAILVVEDTVVRYPVEPVFLADVCGAGDTFVAAFTLYKTTGKDWGECIMVANEAARIVVQKPGVQTCSIVELNDAYSDMPEYAERES